MNVLKKINGRIICNIFGIKIKIKIQKNNKLKDVIWPIKNEALYNKRINNYLLEKSLGYKARRWCIEQLYYNVTKRFPNLDNPKSLNEKMQWMRFNYHDPLMTKCVDKYSFKDYINCW
ncbi:MAG: hypothetical protein Q4E61_02270 [Alphaproteobacteria bacterium]|nr:hypothetical protein [Alphaproteobacteria bacterium]